jgi:hypothetical protein
LKIGGTIADLHNWIAVELDGSTAGGPRLAETIGEDLAKRPVKSVHLM